MRKDLLFLLHAYYGSFFSSISSSINLLFFYANRIFVPNEKILFYHTKYDIGFLMFFDD